MLRYCLSIPMLVPMQLVTEIVTVLIVAIRASEWSTHLVCMMLVNKAGGASLLPFDSNACSDAVGHRDCYGPQSQST